MRLLKIPRLTGRGSDVSTRSRAFSSSSAQNVNSSLVPTAREIASDEEMMLPRRSAVPSAAHISAVARQRPRLVDWGALDDYACRMGLPATNTAQTADQISEVIRLTTLQQSDRVELDGDGSGRPIDAEPESISPILEALHQTVTPVEPDSPEEVKEIMKTRKREVVLEAGRRTLDENGKLSSTYTIAGDYVGTMNRFGSDIYVTKPGKKPSPYGGKKGLLPKRDSEEGRFFFEDLKSGIASGNFMIEKVKEFHAITIQEGIRSQSALTDFAHVLSSSETYSDFYDKFFSLTYAQKGGAKAQRFKRIENESDYSDTDSEEAEAIDTWLPAKYKHYQEARKKFKTKPDQSGR